MTANPQPADIAATALADAAAAEAARKRGQRRRSLAIALSLIAFCVLFYVLTIVRLGPAIFERAL